MLKALCTSRDGDKRRTAGFAVGTIHQPFLALNVQCTGKQCSFSLELNGWPYLSLSGEESVGEDQNAFNM